MPIAARSRLPSANSIGRLSALAPIRDDAFAAIRQAYLDALPVAAAVVTTARDGVAVLAANARFLRLDGPGAEETVLDRARCGKRLLAVLDGQSTGEKFEWRDGGMIVGRHFTVAIAPLAPAGEQPLALVSLLDRTSEVQTAASLRAQMLSDPLTGLPNRAGFVELLENRIADDGPDHYAVAIVDLARFSRVNEGIGSLGGDELIITVARRLMSVLRGVDRVGRTGANEFGLVIRLEDGPGDILQVARRIEAALAVPCRLSDLEIKVDCAIGCALATGDGKDAEQLMRHAQLALKAAKSSKRVELYQPSALNAARRRFVLETELRRAIDGDRLELVYQPLVSFKSGRIAGFEALARWHDPDHGAISPNEFIPVAEDSGLIVPLGRWALDRALKTLAAWDVAANTVLPVYIGVNLSAIQIARDDIAATVSAALRDHRLAGFRLSIELTESAIVADPGRAAKMLDALKACDAMVAMDDFGTGFSNLASLQRLPIDTLKIDRSFVTEMLADKDKVAIVRAILSLAQALGMTTTAEGVETSELALMLGALGCTTGQGWHYSAPLTADAALAFARKSLG